MLGDNKKILLAFGTRPEIIKLATVIRAIENEGLKDSVLIVNTNQHNELIEHQINFWKINVDINFQIDDTNYSLTSLLSQTLNQFQRVIDDYPSLEYIIIQGDTNTALAGSQISYFNRLKLIHIESGLRTNKLYTPFPEEFNRIIASIVAYHHFAPTELNKKNLLKEGVSPQSISVVGNTIIDALKYAKKQIGVQSNSVKNKVVVTIHRREKSHKCYEDLVKTIKTLKQNLPHLSFIWVSHPNNLELVTHLTNAISEIEVLNHLSYIDFLKLYDSSCLVITDSGGVTEESVHLGIPTIVYRSYTERVEPIETGYPFLISQNAQEILSFAEENFSKTFLPGDFYNGKNTSKKIALWIKKELNKSTFNTIVIGGGPAGTGLFMKSIKDGTIDQFLSKGLCLIEASDSLVTGQLSNYQVNSDTYSNVFLECLDGAAENIFDLDRLNPAIRSFQLFEDDSIPLSKTGLLLDEIGLQLTEIINQHEASTLSLNTTVTEVHENRDGTFRVISGNNQTFQAKNLVVACGGIPKPLQIDKNYRSKTIHSDQLIKGEADKEISELNPEGKIIIIGGSHSAFSAAHYLLENHESLISEEHPIEIWAKEVPKLYFQNPETAREHKYFDFTDDDICHKTNRVFRLAGLRMDGRQLFMNMLGIGNDNRENRVVFRNIGDSGQIPIGVLKNTKLIIEAIGYRFNLPKFYDKNNVLMSFLGEETEHWVDEQCQLLLSDGNSLKNTFATGLASGFIPKGVLGGEKSFKSQTNGLWYYQNIIADIILDQLK